MTREATRRGAWPAVVLVLVVLLTQYRDGALLGRHWLSFDNAFQNFPWHHFVHSARDGRDVFAPAGEMSLGFPLWVEPQVDIFYPLNTAWWPGLDVYRSFTLKFLLHIAIGAVGMACLARWQGLSPLAAAAAAIVFSGGSFMVHRLKHPALLQPWCWAPWVVLCFSRAMAGEGRLWLLLAVGAQGLQLLTGHPQMVLPTALLCLVAGVTAQPSERSVGRRLLTAGAAYAAVIGVVAVLDLVKWLPAVWHLAEGPRTGRTGLDWMLQTSANFREAMLNLTPWIPAGDVYEMTSFSSTAAVLALVLGLGGALSRRWRAWVGVAGVGLFLAWAVGNPLYRLLVHVPFVNRFRSPSRYGALYTFGAALLLGAVVDQLARIPWRRWWLCCLATVLVLGCAAAIGGGGLTAWRWDAVAVQLAALAAAMAAGAVVACAGRVELGRWLVVGAVALELLWFGTGVMPSSTREEYEASEECRLWCVAAELCRRDDSAVVMWLGHSADDRSLLYGCRQPVCWTAFPLPGVESLTGMLFKVVPFRTLAAYGVGWICTRADVGRKLGLEPVRAVGRWRFYRNPVTPSQAYVPAYLLVGEAGALDASLVNLDADPRRYVVVGPEAVPAGYRRGAGGTARIVSESPREVRVLASSSAGMLVVLARCWAPGWRVTVDGGAPRPAVAVNLILLSATAPAGEHELVFRYDPDIADVARITIGAWSLWGLLLLVELVVRRRREGRAGGEA